MALLALSLLAAPAAHAAVPSSASIHGFLSTTGGGAVADGDYDMKFAIYNVSSGGSPGWSESAKKVAVKGGRFAHTLGSAKPLSAAVLDQFTSGWLGVTVGSDPELTRLALNSVPYALLADAAKTLACSGCVKDVAIEAGTISASKVGFTFAGAKTKGGPADMALDLQCSGCVSVSELGVDADLNLGGNALIAKSVSATTVIATTFKGDGSQLTGIVIPSGKCNNAGEVVKGIQPDGTLICVAGVEPSALPADGIDEISNNLLHNQFQNEDCLQGEVLIKDHNPIGVSASLTFGDYGLAQKLDVLVDLKNSDLSSVTIKLFDPDNAEYILWDKNSNVNTLSGVWPGSNQTVKGDLSTWVNKNPAGKWQLQVIDGGYSNGEYDGSVSKFCVKIQTLSNQKIEVQGHLLVGNDKAQQKLVVNGDVEIKGNISVSGKSWYSAFPPGSRPVLYGWFEDGTHGNWIYYETHKKLNYASEVAIDNQSLHKVTDTIIWADQHGNLIKSRQDPNRADSTNDSQQVLVVFVKNVTGAQIAHTVNIRYSARDTSRRASVAVNGANIWSDGTRTITAAPVALKFPANKTSVVVLKCGTYYWTGSSAYYQHRNVCGYYKDAWKLPAGLEWDYQRFHDWMANK